MTSDRARTRSASTWATCAARPRRAASRGSCTRCAAWATCSETEMRSLPLRRRMTIAVALAVAVAVALAAAVCYFAVRGELRGEVDRALQDQLLIRRGPPRGDGRGPGFGPLPGAQGGPTPWIQIVDAAGNVLSVRGYERSELPVDGRARDAAAGVGPQYFRDADVDGTHVRVFTVPLGDGSLAVQFARSLEGADSVLGRLRLILALVILGGVALAVALGRLVSRNVVAPIAHVSEAARHIAA